MKSSLRKQPRGKFMSTNQKQYPDLGNDASSVWNSCARRLSRHLAGKPVVASPNVGCFLRLDEILKARIDIC